MPTNTLSDQFQGSDFFGIKVCSEGDLSANLSPFTQGESAAASAFSPQLASVGLAEGGPFFCRTAASRLSEILQSG